MSTMVKSPLQTGVSRPVFASASLMRSAILASSFSIVLLGCGLACTVSYECVNLSPEHVYAGVCLSVLSFVPVVWKWLELRRLDRKSSLNTTDPNDRSWHSKVTKGDDNKTQDTRSTCSWYSAFKRCHRRQTSCNTAASSLHDEEFLNSIRNHNSVLDCRSHSSEEAEPREDMQEKHDSDDKESWLDEVVVTNPTRAKDWVEQAAAADRSSCSSFEESHHPLSPTGYISLVKAFSSHSMGADDDCPESEDLYWDQAGKYNEDENGEMIHNQLSESVQIQDESEHSSLNSAAGLPFSSNARDVLSGMLEETINQMQESSKRMRNAMKGRVEKMAHADCDSRDDINFGIASSACGTLNMALMKSFTADKREPACNDQDPCLPIDSFASSPYPLKRSLPKLSTMQMHGGNVPMIKEVVFETKLPVDADPKDTSDEIGHQDVLKSASSMLSAPDDEKQQDAQITKEEDSIIHVAPTQVPRNKGHARRRGASQTSISEDIDLLSITHSLSMSIKKGVQCHRGIESVASSE